jgi:hypothetical protein
MVSDAAADGHYLQNPRGVHVPSVGGLGQSALLPHSLVQIITIMTIWHESYVGSVQSALVVHDVPKPLPPPPLLEPLELPELLPLLDPLELPELLPLLEPLELPELPPEFPELLPLELPPLEPPLLGPPPVSPEPLEQAPEAAARTIAHAAETIWMDLMHASMNRPRAEASARRTCSEGFTFGSTRCNERHGAWIARDSGEATVSRPSSWPDRALLPPTPCGTRGARRGGRRTT